VNNLVKNHVDKYEKYVDKSKSLNFMTFKVILMNIIMGYPQSSNNSNK